jgi:PmbA protein
MAKQKTAARRRASGTRRKTTKSAKRPATRKVVAKPPRKAAAKTPAKKPARPKASPGKLARAKAPPKATRAKAAAAKTTKTARPAVRALPRVARPTAKAARAGGSAGRAVRNKVAEVVRAKAPAAKPTAPRPVTRAAARPNSVAAQAARGATTLRTVATRTKAAGPDENLLADLVRWAQQAGADSADAVFVHGDSLSVAQRLGQREKLERAEGHDLGLRVFVGRRQASVSSTDFEPGALRELAARAVAMARAVPEDPVCGLADPDQLGNGFPPLDLDDGREPAAEELLELVGRAEEAALAVKGVTNSEGADAGWGRTAMRMVASNGFAGSYARAGYSLSCSVLAGEGTHMQRDYEWTSAVHGSDMMAAEEVGRRAGENTVRKLRPRKLKSGEMPVLFDRRVSGSLLGHLAGAINGRAIARGTSFLKDRMGGRIFGEGITITDDPHRRRGLGSRPFDGEGLSTRRMAVIDDGVLTTWLLDLASARQLGLAPTGHAARGVSGPPSPSTSNFYLQPGTATPEELMADIGRGLYITELIGFGVNGITGDYSRGAGGFMIENGRLGPPVSEVTVAGNLKDMFARLVPANDLEFKGSTNAPTVRIDGMMLAGE